MKNVGASVKVQAWITPEQREKLRRRAKQQGISESALLRRIVENVCAGIPSEPDPEV